MRRELLRANKTSGIARLDALKMGVGYAALSESVLLQSATFWAQARQMGKPTAPDPALDGDMILCAQATVLSNQGHSVLVATTNVKHLKMFIDAQLWRNIK